MAYRPSSLSNIQVYLWHVQDDTQTDVDNVSVVNNFNKLNGDPFITRKPTDKPKQIEINNSVRVFRDRLIYF